MRHGRQRGTDVARGLIQTPKRAPTMASRKKHVHAEAQMVARLDDKAEGRGFSGQSQNVESARQWLYCSCNSTGIRAMDG